MRKISKNVKNRRGQNLKWNREYFSLKQARDDEALGMSSQKHPSLHTKATRSYIYRNLYTLHTFFLFCSDRQSHFIIPHLLRSGWD